MHQAVTVGMIVWPLVCIFVFVVVIGIVAAALSILGNAFKD